ncbi:hypothetical protein C1H76_3120 [Elsinoe australis]|uniref:Uncharacterized protein n=1 Tax=Elsinoe australis TaxID=40998 RepID=A0A4U7B0G3_9PEZI|nr:hypothetical protein C1H76_3120 [Elsinoe australis]
MHFLSILASSSALISVVAATGTPLPWNFSLPHSHQNVSSNNDRLDKSPSIEEQRPWNHGRLLTTDHLLAAVFPYSAVTLEAVISPLRIIARSFLERKKPHKHLGPGDTWAVSTIPTYADLTDQGWRANMHGHAYVRDIPLPFSRHLHHVDKLIERLLFRATLDKTHHKKWRKHFYLLDETEKNTARIRANTYMEAPLKDLDLSVWFTENCNTSVKLQGPTDREGGFAEDIFVPLACNTSTTQPTQSPYRVPILEVSVEPTTPQPRSNAAPLTDTGRIHLVPPKGLTIISDIDDVLRVAEV